jgi:hypothetical protein
MCKGATVVIEGAIVVVVLLFAALPMYAVGKIYDYVSGKLKGRRAEESNLKPFGSTRFSKPAQRHR